MYFQTIFCLRAFELFFSRGQYHVCCIGNHFSLLIIMEYVGDPVGTLFGWRTG